MKIVITGKRTEGKTLLAHLIVKLLSEMPKAHYVFSLTESDGKSQALHEHDSDITGWTLNDLRPRSVDIVIEQNTEEVWD